MSILRRLASPLGDPARRQRLTRGLPALALLLVAPGLVLIGRRQAERIPQRYGRTATDAMATRDLRLAELCVRRLLDEGDQPATRRYQLGKLRLARGESDEALEWLRALSGFGQADLLSARILIERRGNGDLQRAEEHLRRAIRSKHSPPAARPALALILVSRHRDAEAAAVLAACAGARSMEPGVLLSACDAVLGSLEARSEHHRTIARLAGAAAAAIVRRDLAALDDTSRLPMRKLLASALQRLGRHEQAIEVLEAVPERDRVAAQRVLATTLFRWAAALEPAHLRRSALFRRALYAAGNRPGVILGLFRLPGEEGQQMRALVDALGQGEKWDFAVGTALYLDGRYDAAERRLQAVFDRLGLADPVYANNLATCLAESESRPKLKRGLTLIDAVLARHPGRAGLLETRGRLLARLGRARQALPLLEGAIDAGIANGGTYRFLARAYATLGNRVLSEKFAARARQAHRRSESRATRYLQGWARLDQD